MGERIKGFIHVHSEFSRDGLSAVADLADFARGSGFRFVGLTDHAEDLSPEEMRNLRRECEEHSDAGCVMIPGLEFRCVGETHILGLGVADPIMHDDPVVVASEIGAKGGLAILAHPCRNDYRCPPELCAVLNAVEIWNAAYDGCFVPPLAGLRLLQEARGVNPSIFGIGGADLHGLHRPPGVVLELPVTGSAHIDACMVLRHLGTGLFSVCGRYVRFDAKTVPRRLTRIPLWSFRKLYEASKTIRNLALGEN